MTTQGSPYYEQVSGSPDGSVSASECETYDTSVTYGGTLDSTSHPSGCYRAVGTSSTIWYNTNLQGSTCNANQVCIQRRFHGGDFNYIFGKALFMLDYRQVDMSSIYFGDPAYGTPVLGVESKPIPYASVIQDYCDVGEQPNKRFGPCVNLKNTRVNGKIYIKHFHDSDHYKVKELKTRDSKTSNEYYEMESGAPDLSVNEAECRKYFTGLGYGFTVDLFSEQSGCFIIQANPDNNKGFYNTKQTTITCSSGKIASKN